MANKREARKQKREKKHVEKKEAVDESLIDQVRTDLNELQNIIANQIPELPEKANQLLFDKLNLIEEEIKDLKRENNELKVKYDELKVKYDELQLEHDELKLEQLKLEQKEMKLEREKEVNRKCRDFVGRFLFKLSRKLNDDFRKLSDEYYYGNNQEVKKKIESQLGFVKMKAEEFKQISDFRLVSSYDYSHDVKKQSAYETQIMLSNMDFPKDMEYLRTPLNKVLKALQIWDNEN